MDFLELNTAYSNIFGDVFNKKISYLEYLLKRIMLIYKTEKIKNSILIDRAIELIESIKFPSYKIKILTSIQKNILENFIHANQLFLNQSKEYLLLLKTDNSREEQDNLRLIIAAQRAILNCRMLVVQF